jgi:UDP-N-acetylglucosamine 2-epimerase (non-hydrolysing)
MDKSRNNTNKKAIAYVLGTKAMFIKTKYIIKYFVDANVELIVLDTGQHKEITSKEIKNLENNFQIFDITKSDANVSSIFGMIIWFFNFTFSNKKNKKLENLDYCLLHGDTVSTLMGLIYAKKNKLKTIHVEAGYRSKNYFRPFPEELIRSLVTHFSDVLVVDGDDQYANVKKYENIKKIIKISRNTIFDAVTNEVRKIKRNELNQLTITIHRTENIYNKKSFDSLILLINKILEKNTFDTVKWFCHDVTVSALEKRNMKKFLENSGVILSPLLPYKDFIKEVYNSKAVITDGGSIAEECSILNIKTLVWRDVIEHQGITGDNLFLSNYNIKNSINFLSTDTKNKKVIHKSSTPSQELVDRLLEII